MNTPIRALALFLILFACAKVHGYDWNNLSEKDIAEIRAERHAFYARHSHGIQAALLENSGNKVDGNQNDFDMRYYGLHLNLDFVGDSIVASVDYRIKSLISGLTRVDLNLRDELTVDSVRVGVAPASFSHSAHLLSINLPSSIPQNQEFALTVYYHGVPYYDGDAGLTFTSQFSTQLCWTKATPFRSRYWWPSKDFPEDKVDSLDLYIECPSTYDIATNGLRVSSTSLGGGRKLEHFKHNYPICTYLVAFCCATYTKDIQTWVHGTDSLPYYCYSLPGNTAAMTAFKNFGPQSLTMLTNRYGQYPFMGEKMGCADFGWAGAMEHQTFAMFATDFHTDWVIAHESSHQWWGDMITCRTFNHIWLNEGFATYSEPLFMEATAGINAYFNYLQTMKFMGPGSIYVENLTQDDIYDSNLSYDKAGWVLHMLRGVYGDSLFFQGVRAYATSGLRYGTAVTADFDSIFGAVAGDDITWFLNEWIYGEGHPDYEYSWQCRPNGSGAFIVDMFIEQVQATPTAFRMPIKTRITGTAGTRDSVIWNQGRFAAYQITFADSITAIQLDPQQWILRSVLQKPMNVHILGNPLPNASYNQPYSAALEAVGGVEPYHWQFLGGDLPFGIEFDTATATFSGIPTYVADYYFTLTCHDSGDPLRADTVSLGISVIEPQWVCGDANGSSTVTVSDVVYMINFIFGGGPAPNPLASADVNCSGGVSISDAVYLINYIFGGGAAPCASCP